MTAAKEDAFVLAPSVREAPSFMAGKVKERSVVHDGGSMCQAGTRKKKAMTPGLSL